MLMILGMIIMSNTAQLKDCPLGNEIFKLVDTDSTIMMQLLERLKELEQKVLELNDQLDSNQKVIDRVANKLHYEGYSSK